MRRTMNAGWVWPMLAIALAWFLWPALASAQTYPCAGPGPGERMVGMTQGGLGVAASPLCMREDSEGPPSQKSGAKPANHGDGWLRYETGKWTESFGALADDGRGVKGSSGRSEDSTSAQAARKEALRDCGKQDCQIRIEVRNGCWAVAYGKSSTFYFGTEIDMVGADPKTAGLKQVSSKAMAMCKQAGDVNCEVRNTSCSLPSSQ